MGVERTLERPRVDLAPHVRATKKVVWTLDVGRYDSEITALTYPLFRRYAARIGAEFRIIEERRYPDFPAAYEKLQIHDLGRGNDWNIFFDADALVHPDTPDFTELIGKETVIHNGVDPAMLRWKYDRFFWRDGRNLGSCNWLAIASDWCIDLWEPLSDLTLEEAVANIRPINAERRSGEIDPPHLLDDYMLSRNIARYGLKVEIVPSILKRVGLVHASGEPFTFFWHMYAVPRAEKIKQMREVIANWKVEDLVP